LAGSGTPAVQHSVTFTWKASISKNVVGYNIYRGTRSGGPYTKINTALHTSTHDIDYNVRAGASYYYVVRAVNSAGVQSPYSKQAKAVIP
jgi:fibronectin type 3 domain-containing protein